MGDLLRDERRLYWSWVGANAWAEAAGLGTTFVAGWALQSTAENVSGAVSIVLAAALAVLLGTVLEGVLVGWAQESTSSVRDSGG